MILVYAWRNVLARRWSTAITTIGVAISVMVFIVMSATADGISRVATQTGAATNVLVLAKGASSAEVSQLDRATINRVRTVSGLARDAGGDTLASTELVLARAIRRVGAGEAEGRYVTLRGVGPEAFRVHEGVRIVSGEYPNEPGQVLIGNLLARKLGGVKRGDELWIGSQRSVVSGTIEAAGQVFAGELWADLGDLQSSTGRRLTSAVVLQARQPGDVENVIAALDRMPGLNIASRPEREYYKDIQQASLPFVTLGNLIGIILGLGAVMAGMNTIYAAMSRRIRELGTLRALGFGKWFVGSSLLLESVLVGLLGGLLGGGLAMLFDGFALSLLSLSFELSVEPGSLIGGLTLAFAIGFLGGLLPALAALRLQIIDALRGA